MEVIIISAPSGGGKGSVVEYLLNSYPELFTRSISDCTRDISDHEKSNKHYNKVSKKEFEKRNINGHYFESEEVYTGDFYGTPNSEIKRAKDEGKILLLDIDVAGACRVKNNLKKESLFIFIDSGDDLQLYQNRIINRGRSTDTIEKIRKRVDKIPKELNDGRFSADEIVGNNSTLKVLESFIFKILVKNNII